MLVVIPLAAHAQDRQQRDGFGISFGPALAGGSYHCGTCDDSFGGMGGYLRLGQYLRPDLFVGAEINLHTIPIEYIREDTNVFSGVVQWYPQTGNGFYLKGSAGFARISHVVGEDDPEKHTLSGPAIGLSLGYDISTRRSFLLTPFVSATYVTRSDYKEGGTVRRSASASIFQIGLGFSWY